MTPHDRRPDPPGPRGLGGLVTTEVDRLSLGSHHGRELYARVERRSARFSAGRQWHLAISLGRTRPVAIEVSTPGERYDLPIVTADPWWRLARRISALAIAATAVLVVAGRLRTARNRE